MTRNTTIVILLLLALEPVVGHAQLELASVRQARQRLVPYRAATLGVIADLSRQIPGLTRRADIMDVRYLRAVAATDLVLLEHLGHGVVTKAAVAEVFEIDPSDLLQHLHDELSDVAAGAYLAECADAMRAIEAMEGGSPEWGEASTRKDVFALLELAQRSRATDAIAQLAEVGEDPCGAGPCTTPFNYFEESGRRAVQAVLGAEGRLTTVERRVRDGADPLAAALGEPIRDLRRHFDELVLRPRPNWRELLGRPTVVASASGARSSVEHVLHVDPATVHFVPRPTVRVTGGRAEMSCDRKSVALPGSRRPFITSIPAVAEWLATIEVDDPIALSADPAVEALALWQVIASAERAGTSLRELAVVDEAGWLHTRAFQIQDSFASDMTQVFVRLGGYSVRMGARQVTVPRRMVDGGWQHDRQTLRQTVGRGDNVAFKTMGVAPADLLLHAVFTPEARITTLVRR